MTKSQESGDNEFATAAKREAARTGNDICVILALMRQRARAVGDRRAVRKIQKAEKYLGCRNINKRKGR